MHIDMEGDRPRLEPGLYVVSTPIGNSRDITLWAIDVLSYVDEIAAEDTRSIRKLMNIHGIARAGRTIRSYHDHSSSNHRENILTKLSENKSVALVAEAGTPLISDPGQDLVSAAIAKGIIVRPIPGPCACIAALVASGLSTDRFMFLGFLPSQAVRRRREIRDIARFTCTLIIYESPKRLAGTLRELAASFDSRTRAVVCRELTKFHEEVCHGNLAELADLFDVGEPKGECVIVIDKRTETAVPSEEIERCLRDAMQRLSLKDAVAEVSESLGESRREIYRRALKLARERDKSG